MAQREMLKNFLVILALFVGWFFILHTFIILGNNRVHFSPDTSYEGIFSLPDLLQQGPPLANFWQRWDAHWYLGIADHGYYYKPNEYSSTAFFPLYPLLIQAVTFLTHGNPAIIGILLSSLFTFLSCLLLFYLAKELWNNKETAFRSALFLLIFPTAFFLISPYTESLFLLLSLASFYCAHKQKWFFAILSGIFLTATRTTGILIILPLLLLYFEHHPFSLKNVLTPKFLGLFLIPIGLLVFATGMWAQFGDPFIFLKSQSAWHRNTNLTPQSLIGGYQKYISDFKMVQTAETPEPVASRIIDITCAVIFLALTLLAWFVLPRSYALFSTLLLTLPLLTGTFQSMPRFALSAFPLFLVLGKITKNQLVFSLLFLFSTLFFGLLSILYVNFYWIA